MNFEFPDEDQYIELAQINSIKELKSILNAYKQFYKNQNIAFYYEIRVWTLNKNNQIHKIGAYCKYCNKAKLVYSRNYPHSPYQLEQIISIHQNHPQINQTINQTYQTSSIALKITQSPSKTHKSNNLISQKQIDNLYKEYIIQWLIQYEKTLNKILLNPPSQGKLSIDSHMIRSSISVQSDIIDEYSENDLFFRDYLWNQLVSQVLKKEGFTRKPFLKHLLPQNQDQENSFINCLIIKQKLSSQKQGPYTTYLLRRQIKVDVQPNLVNHSQGQEINCLVAFSYVPNKSPQLLWMAFAEKKPQIFEDKPQELKEILNLLEAILQVETIRTFHQGLVFIEDDHQLMLTFTMFKEVMLRELSSFNHNVCIYPLVMDELIMHEKVSGQLKQTLRQAIRCRQQSQAIEIITKAMSNGQKDKKVIEGFLKVKNFTWVSCMPHLNQRKSINFLPKEFYERNKIKNVFTEVSDLTRIKNSITLNEVPIVLIKTFMSISKSSSQVKQNTVFDISQYEWSYFLMAIQRASHEVEKNWIKISQKPNYELRRVILSCCRIIIQLLYYNISRSFSIEIQNVRFEKVQENHFIKVRDKQLRSFKIQFSNASFRDKKAQKKLWYCECESYNFYGVPCEHEILCALNYETSLFRELSQDWRTRQSTETCDKSRMITSFLNKIIL